MLAVLSNFTVLQRALHVYKTLKKKAAESCLVPSFIAFRMAFVFGAYFNDTAVNCTRNTVEFCVHPRGQIRAALSKLFG